MLIWVDILENQIDYDAAGMKKVIGRNVNGVTFTGMSCVGCEPVYDYVLFCSTNHIGYEKEVMA